MLYKTIGLLVALLLMMFLLGPPNVLASEETAVGSACALMPVLANTVATAENFETTATSAYELDSALSYGSYKMTSTAANPADEVLTLKLPMEAFVASVGCFGFTTLDVRGAPG